MSQYRGVPLISKHVVLWICSYCNWKIVPDSKVHGTNMGPTWVLTAPDGFHVDPMNLAIRGQDDSHGRPWMRWSQAWTSPVMISAVSLTTFRFLCIHQCHLVAVTALIARFARPPRGPSGADRTQMGPCWLHELCYLGVASGFIQYRFIQKSRCSSQ